MSFFQEKILRLPSFIYFYFYFYALSLPRSRIAAFTVQRKEVAKNDDRCFFGHIVIQMRKLKLAKHIWRHAPNCQQL